MQPQITLDKFTIPSSNRDASTTSRTLGDISSRVLSGTGASLRIAHVGTYPPNKCGIATYMQDVVTAVHSSSDAASPVVVAMDTKGEDIRYHWPVRHIITKDRPADYIATARALRSEGVDLISLQHEHGIFGGEAGEYAVDFLNALEGRIPVVTTFHTVVPDPSPEMRRNLRMVAERSERIVVLNSRAVPILKEKYGIPTFNVTAIPHGTPHFDQSRRQAVREAFGVDDVTVLLTFGLISPGKGLEHAIEAVAANADVHPALHYYILGATHPSIVKHSGESYRDKLVALAEDLGVADRVHFVNRYLELDELKDWLLATDIYVTPYINSNQIVSGTLSYAVAAGKPVLSTPYIHAVELLEGKAGLLTPFNDPGAMAANLNLMLTDSKLREGMKLKAKEFAALSAWPEVGKRYLELYRSAVTSKPPYDTGTKLGVRGTTSNAAVL